MSLRTFSASIPRSFRPASRIPISQITRSIVTRPTAIQPIPKQYRMSSVVASAASAAHSAVASLASVAQTKAGDAVPDVNVKINDPEGKLNFSKLTGKNVLVLVPGAFSGVCSNQVPPYVEQYDAFKAKGVEDIYVVAVNDIFVVNAWKEQLGGKNVKFAADDTASLAASLGLILNAPEVFGGPRFKRAAVIIDGGKVKWVGVEDSPGDITVAKADNVLKQL